MFLTNAAPLSWSSMTFRLSQKEIEAFQHIQNIEEISGEHNAEVLSDKVQNDMQESLRLIRAAAAAESTSSVECSLLCFERDTSRFDVDGNEIIREVRWIVSSASEWCQILNLIRKS